jgi:hypothetical protein
MKKLLLILLCVPLIFSSCFVKKSTQHKELNSQIVEASCGQCKFNLPGNGCELAVRIEGKAYFVDGTKIDNHGDPHASGGFCTTIRKAYIDGDIIDNRFRVKSFKLIPLD